MLNADREWLQWYELDVYGKVKCEKVVIKSEKWRAGYIVACDQGQRYSATWRFSFNTAEFSACDRNNYDISDIMWCMNDIDMSKRFTYHFRSHYAHPASQNLATPLWETSNTM